MADDPKDPLDPKSFLLPKKEAPGSTTDSAQRIEAGKLVAQEENARAEGLTPGGGLPSDDEATSGDLSADKSPYPEGVKPVAPAVSHDPDVVRPLKTYKGDVESLIQEGGVSEVSIAAAEAVRKEKEKKEAADAAVATPAAPPEPGAWRRWAYVGGGVVLLVAAGGLLGWTLLTPTEVPLVPGAPTTLIVVDEARVVGVAPPRSSAMETLEQARQSSQLALGLLEWLYLSATPNTPEPPPYDIQSLLSLLAPEIPPEFLRTLTGEYLLGVHSFDRNQPLLLLKTDSYDVAYRGMLSWERTMSADLSPLFAREISPTLDETPLPSTSAVGDATSTSATSTTPIEPEEAPLVTVLATNFVDRVVENRNVRALENSEGEIVLLWTFIDRGTILITTNGVTLREVVTRITNPPLQYQP